MDEKEIYASILESQKTLQTSFQQTCQNIFEGQKTFQQTICEMLRTSNKQIQDNINKLEIIQNENNKRLHERMDQIIQQETIKRPDCEEYRQRCSQAVCGKITKASGVQPWVAIILGLASSIIVGETMFIVTSLAKIVGGE